MDILYARSYADIMNNQSIRSELIRISRARKHLPNIAILLFGCLMLGSSITAAYTGSVIGVVIGTILMAQAKLWAWYLSHDCAHGAVMNSKRANHIVGTVCSWLNGLGYSPFNSYRSDHMRHHVDKTDLIGTDIRLFIEKMPPILQNVLVKPEKILIPSLYYAIKYSNIAAELSNINRRRKLILIGILIIHLLGYLFTAIIAPTVLVSHVLSSFIRIHVVRFVDCYQHTYRQIEPEISIARESASYEAENTFSMPVAKKYTWLNLIILNFGYHNAHHLLPTCPWYQLPILDGVILKHLGLSRRSRDTREDRIGLLELIKSYKATQSKRFRLDDAGTAYNTKGHFSLERFTGAYTDKLLG